MTAFFRHDSENSGLLIVMDLSQNTEEKDLSFLDGDFALAVVLNINEESSTYQDSKLTLPAYSIAVFTIR